MTTGHSKSGFNAQCPHCRARYVNIPREKAGRSIRCRKCRKGFVIELTEDSKSGVPAGEVGFPTAGKSTDADPQQRSSPPPPRVGQRPEPAPTVRARVIAAGNRAAKVLKSVEWTPGQVILDRYRVLGVLGQGGMGRVYKVRHNGWRIDLAVKTPTSEILTAVGGADDFEREAETWVNLGLHPHVVSCYYVRRVDEVPCVFAEYVAGGSLHDWIYGPEGGPGSLYQGGPKTALARCLDVAIQFAWGLQYAHHQGLVHQDVKPANLMLCPDGLAKVTDFGLAMFRASHEESAASDPDQTRPFEGSHSGTPQYFSPEQSTGGALSSRSDIWSWGLSLLEMFKGGRTWESGTVAQAVLEEYLSAGPEWKWLPVMPEPVAELIGRTFEYDSRNRPGDLKTLAFELIEVFQEVTGRAYHRHEPKEGPTTADSLNNRAASLLDLGRLSEAEGLWGKALSVQPHHLESTYNLGLIQWRSARLNDDALLKRLMESTRSHRSDWTGLYMQAMVHGERDDLKGLYQALKSVPKEEISREEIRTAAASAKKRGTRSSRLLAGLKGHRGNVNAVCLNAGGTRALTGGDDREIRYWDLDPVRTIKILKGHDGPILDLCLSGDERYALSAGGDFSAPDHKLRLWNLAEGRQILTLDGHEKKVSAICLNQNASVALSAGDDRTVRLWDVASQQARGALKGAEGSATAIWLSPDGRYALLAGRDLTIRLWDFDKGRCLRTYSGHKGRITSIAVSRNRKFFLSGSYDQTVRMWNLSQGRLLKTLTGHTASVNSVDLSQDGGRAVSGSSDQTVKIWLLENGRCLRTFEGHGSWVLSVSMNKTGLRCLSGGLESDLKYWRIENKIDHHQAPMLLSRVTGSDKAFAAKAAYENHLEQAKKALSQGHTTRTAAQIRKARAQAGYGRGAEAMRMWIDLYLRLPRRTLSGGWEHASLKGHKQDVNAVFLSQDCRYAISGSQDMTLRLWETARGGFETAFHGHEAAVNAVALNENGTLAVSGSSDRTVRLWDIETGRCLNVFEGHTKGVNTVCMTPDGTFILSGGEDRIVKIWETGTGRLIHELTGHQSAVNSIVTSLDAGYALSAAGDYTGEDNVIKLWDISSGQCLKTMAGHERSVNTISLNPDGRTALSGGSDRSIILWDLAAGERIRTLEGHDDAVNSVCMSADGRFAISGGYDRLIKLWDTTSGQCLRTFEGHSDSVTSVVLSPNGQYAVSSGADKMIKLWTLDWTLGAPPKKDWDNRADPWLTAFMKRYSRPDEKPADLEREPPWTNEDFEQLLYRLGCAGLGWLSREKVLEHLFSTVGIGASTPKEPDEGTATTRPPEAVRDAGAPHSKPSGFWGFIKKIFRGKSVSKSV